jgi:hypothetical protein
MKAFHRLSLGMVVAVLTIGVVIVRHVSDVGKFDDLDHNRLLKDSELLVNFYVQEGRDYWKASELPIECSYVNGTYLSSVWGTERPANIGWFA